jgi:hypothetical protein
VWRRGILTICVAVMLQTLFLLQSQVIRWELSQDSQEDHCKFAALALDDLRGDQTPVYCISDNALAQSEEFSQARRGHSRIRTLLAALL